MLRKCLYGHNDKSLTNMTADTIEGKMLKNLIYHIAYIHIRLSTFSNYEELQYTAELVL